MNEPNINLDMPDVARSDSASHATTLDWVGMSAIALPLRLLVRGFATYQDNEPKQEIQQVASKVQCYVNLNQAHVKGIHMSRLYLLLSEFAAHQTFAPAALTHFASEMLASHADISDQVRIVFNFDLMLQRPALKSQYAGWKAYPCQVEIRLQDQQVKILSDVRIDYSSTCPCSAALARQLVQQEFSKDFADQKTLTRSQVEQWLNSSKGSFATPHSQRSEAYVQIQHDHNAAQFDFVPLIDQMEAVLGTPVQTAVKRADEQAFAQMNGHNLMFCEDAARRLHHQLQKFAAIDFRLKVAHFESLHAHDAVSMASKGIPNGLSW